MFQLRSTLQAEILSLKAENTRLESELAASVAVQSLVTSSPEQIEALTDDLQAACAQVADLSGQVSGLKASLATAEAKASPEVVQRAVIASISAAGHVPLSVIDANPSSGQTVKTRAQFNLMKPKEVSAFFLNGGTLVD